MRRFDDDHHRIYCRGPGRARAGDTKVIKTHETATFVSANFDFDHTDLSTPASYSNGEGISNAGKFTDQAVIEFAPDGNKCTVPGGVANAGTEYTLVGNGRLCALLRRGTFCFTREALPRCVRISPRSQRPLSRSPPPPPRQGSLLAARGNIWGDRNLHIGFQRSDVGP